MISHRLPAPTRLEAITRLYDLEVLAEDFAAKTGIAPELPSHWDPKPAISARMETWIPPPPKVQGIVEYVYPGDLAIDSRIVRRIGETPDRGMLITPSGTTSIVNVCSYLRNIGIRELIIVTPAYFTVAPVAEAFGIFVSHLDVSWRDGRYELPLEIRSSERPAAVWLTFPVYGASVYFSPSDIGRAIDGLADEVAVVVDESLSYPDRENLSETRSMDRVIRISSPHKSLCFNGEKVSFVTFPRHLTDDIDAWSDCYAGGIGIAGIRALQFLAGDAFELVAAKSRNLIYENRKALAAIVSRHPEVCMDKDTDGHFVTLYWPGLPASLGLDHRFLSRLLSESYALPIPSIRNRHPVRCGFCFRVNLFRMDEAGLGGVSRLIEAIDCFEELAADTA